MLSLKSLKIKYIRQLILTYTILLISMVFSFYNVLPKFSVDYKLPMLLLLSAISILYSYILLIKNHYETQLELKNSQIQRIEKEMATVQNSLNNSLDDYKFDSKIGYYQHKTTGELFCGSCLLEDIPAQLKEFDEYWRCVKCGSWFYKIGFGLYKKPNNKKGGDNWVTNY